VRIKRELFVDFDKLGVGLGDVVYS